MATLYSGTFSSLILLRTLNLKKNYLVTMPEGTFNGLVGLKTLDLGNNLFTEIHGKMWIGLQSLNSLSLDENRLQDIPRHGISHMPALTSLDLSSNFLRTLRADIFNPDDYPDSNGRPARLELNLFGNIFLCNTTLCWLIAAADSGTIDIRNNLPTCLNHPDSSLLSIDLNCSPGRKIGSSQMIQFGS